MCHELSGSSPDHACGQPGPWLGILCSPWRLHVTMAYRNRPPTADKSNVESRRDVTGSDLPRHSWGRRQCLVDLLRKGVEASKVRLARLCLLPELRKE